MSRSPVRGFDTFNGLVDLARRATQLHLQRATTASNPLAQAPRQQYVKPTVEAVKPVPFQAPAIPSKPEIQQRHTPSVLAASKPVVSPPLPQQHLETPHILPVQPPEQPPATVAQPTKQPEFVASNIAPPPLQAPAPLEDLLPVQEKRTMLKASKVPTSRFARMFQYGSLAAGLGVGAASASLQRLAGGSTSGSSPLLNEANIRRIVSKLSRMRGAALKLGQFLSIQESKLLPPELETILARVQNAADYMPEWQTRSMLQAELGAEWESRYASFDMVPFAAASIGQVHSATLQDGREVAVKIQFPGVADSIDSDISTLKSLLTFSALLPRGLYLENTLRVMRRELKDECDYVREAECGRLFAKHLANDQHLSVPQVVDELSTARVLTTEMMKGKPLSKTKDLSQSTKDHIGTVIISLCLRELFEFHFMQTDPNWSNFLWNDKVQKLELVDFGASQHYDPVFIDCYKRLLLAAIDEKRQLCADLSRELGYLTENDSELMINAHVDTMLALAEPFRTDSYVFGRQDITARVQALIPTMLHNRTTPPPEATYSLNRKLSGCFLLCARLNSRISCRIIWKKFSS